MGLGNPLSKTILDIFSFDKKIIRAGESQHLCTQHTTFRPNPKILMGNREVLAQDSDLAYLDFYPSVLSCQDDLAGTKDCAVRVVIYCDRLVSTCACV